MRRCKKCLMAETKPGIVFDEGGVCQACLHHAARKDINWGHRFIALESLAKKYRCNFGHYDCIIPVSGGKDSYYQVRWMKEKLQMNPLLVSVTDHYTHTEAGQHNLMNLQEVFNCDLIVSRLDPDLTRTLTRRAFEMFGSPTWPIDQAIYCWPLRVARRMKLPLVVYGENVSYEYGGFQNEDVASAKEQINNDVAKAVPDGFFDGISSARTNMLQYPDVTNLEPIYLSHFTDWSGWTNYQYAVSKGFRTLGRMRSGYIEEYDQIDSVGYLINVYLKYVKFGFGRATDVVGYQIRDGLMTVEAGRVAIAAHDHKLDRLIMEDFLRFTGYTFDEFCEIVHKHKGPEVDLKGYPECLKDTNSPAS